MSALPRLREEQGTWYFERQLNAPNDTERVISNTISNRVIYSQPPGVAPAVWTPGPAWLQPTVNSLVQLLNLQEGWDSYGSRKVEPRAVETVFDLLRATLRNDSPPPAVVPTGAGGVQAEWHQDGLDIEVQVSSAGASSLTYEDLRAGTELRSDLSTDLSALTNAIDELARRL